LVGGIPKPNTAACRARIHRVHCLRRGQRGWPAPDAVCRGCHLQPGPGSHTRATGSGCLGDRAGRASCHGRCPVLL